MRILKTDALDRSIYNSKINKMNEDGTPRQGLVNSSCKFAGYLVPQLKRRMEIHHAAHVCSHVDGMRRLIENYEIRKVDSLI